MARYIPSFDLGFEHLNDTQEVSSPIANYIADVGYKPSRGVRPIDDTIATYVSDPVSAAIIQKRQGLGRTLILSSLEPLVIHHLWQVLMVNGKLWFPQLRRQQTMKLFKKIIVPKDNSCARVTFVGVVVLVLMVVWHHRYNWCHRCFIVYHHHSWFDYSHCWAIRSSF